MAQGSRYPALLDHILEGRHYMPLIQSPAVAKHRARWRQFLNELIACPPHDPAIAARFHVRWHESHHFIRELVADDALMLDLAKVWLPRYVGPSLTLFRGENINRYEAGQIGSAWSDQEDTADTFARGLNAVGSGGLILKTVAPSAAIISGPSDHSANWLREREFTVDPRSLVAIEVTKRFPPSH